MNSPRATIRTAHRAPDAQRHGRRVRPWRLRALGLSLILSVAAPALAGHGDGASGVARAAAPFFSENLGQIGNEDVRYYIDTAGLDVGLTDDAILYVLREPLSRDASGQDSAVPQTSATATRQGVVVRVSFDGANWVRPEPLGELGHRNHYFLGSDSSQWRTNVRNYRGVIYRDLYEGIDLVYAVDDGRVKYDFVVRPEADPGQIAVRYEGIDALAIDRSGNLVAATAVGELRDAAPFSYQGDDEVDCRYALRGPRTYGFDCVTVDPDRVLIIDPVVYGTYLGGADREIAESVAIDAGGNAYVLGHTRSVDYPTTIGAFGESLNGTKDAFITKLSADGDRLVYSTYIGGSEGESVASHTRSIAVDQLGQAYLVGFTSSSDFPTKGAFQTSYVGAGSDGFVVKLSADGSTLIFSTYLGGSESDAATSIAIDAQGNSFVTGETRSSDFPITAGAFNTTFNADGLQNAYVTKLNATGGGPLIYSTFLGAGGGDGIAVDAEGHAYVTGVSGSAEYPTTTGAFDTTLDGDRDAFVTKVNPDGSDLVFSTFLGGSGSELVGGIAVAAGGLAHVAGGTDSGDFPTTAGAYDTDGGAGYVGFVTKLSFDGSALVYSTYFHEYALALDVDGDGNAYLTGETSSRQFPITENADYPSFGGRADGWLSKLNATGSDLLYSSYLGGKSFDAGKAVSVDSADDAYVVGHTGSTDFPTTAGAFDTSHNGDLDAFLVKIRTSCIVPECTVDADCDDGDICTDDSCEGEPGTCSAFCQHLFNPSCDCGMPGDPCSEDAECCSGTCKGKPGEKTCK